MKWRSWLLVAVVAVSLVALLATVKYRQISSAIAFAASFPEPSETVLAAEVRTFEWLRVERTTGEIVATQTVEVKTEYSGTIASVGFASERKVAGSAQVATDAPGYSAHASAT